VPTAGFIATLLLNQSLWMKDDLVSATPELLCIHCFLAFFILSVAAIAFTSVRSDRSAGCFIPILYNCCYYLNPATAALEQRATSVVSNR